MYLYRIELFGFKSFADKTVIELTQGISAILGPNGSGKSNLVDAIKWTLGEQSSKDLRADRMTSVIFNGSEERKALSLAEVSLCFRSLSNSPENKFTDLCIKRRLYRDGTSEYHVNNIQVRLRDLREELARYGIAQSAYSVIEQGKIDQILSSAPDGRRMFFDEIADINHLKTKWVEAERKLVQTEDNSRNIQHIIAEVEKTYKSLQRQAEKANEYRTVQAELIESAKEIYQIRLYGFRETQNKIEENLKKSKLKREDILASIDKNKVSMQEMQATIQNLEKKLNAKSKEEYGLSIEKENIAYQVKNNSERIAEIQKQILRNQNSEFELRKRRDKLTEQLQQVQGQYQELEKECLQTQENIDASGKTIESIQKQILSNSENDARLRNFILECEKSILLLQKKLQSLTDDIVQELDEKLKSIQTEDLRRAEQSLEQAIQNLGSHATLFDQNSWQSDHSHRTNDLLKWIQQSQKILEELTRSISRAFDEYKNCIPTFFEDFLAPEGIITQKREIDSQLGELRTSIEKQRGQIVILSKEKQSLQIELERNKNSQQKYLLLRERLNSKKEDSERQQKNLQGHATDLEAQIEAGKMNISEDDSKMQFLKKQQDDISAQERSIAERGKALKSDQEKIHTQVHKLRLKLNTLEDKHTQSMQTLADAQNRQELQRSALSEVQADIRNLFNNFREQYSEELQDSENFQHEITLEEARERYKSMQNKLRSLGSVNFMAVEDYAEAKERYEFLGSQLDDLRSASADLKEVTAHIWKESTELFMKSFEHVKKQFQELFRQLFGGGRAELRLLDPQNCLDSGIVIFAQPPGKKLESIDQLSGGERALTSIALILAAYKYRPAAFCFLDEIDAALDESNIQRFIGLLSRLASQNQFVIITHNKKTVTVADTLIGITMEEYGVSKMVSIRIAQEVRR